MKIAVVAQPFDVIPPGRGASIPIWIDEVATRFAQDHEVTIYCSQVPEHPADDQTGPIRNARVSRQSDERVVRGIRRMERLLRRPKNDLFYRYYYFSAPYYRSYIRAVARRIREDRPDAILLHNFSQFVPPLRRLNSDVGIVLFMHCDWLVELDIPRVRRRLAGVDAVCGCSDYIANGVARRLPELADRSFGVHNGSHVERFSVDRDGPSEGLRERLGIGSGAVVTFVGRLAPEKGAHVLIDAMRVVLDRRPDTTLLIVGGPTAQPPSPRWVQHRDEEFRQFEEIKRGYVDRLQRQAEPMADRIRFLGTIPHYELADYYRLSDIFVHPAIWNEPFGMILTEAMACELPVVSTRAGGIPEIVVQGETGLLAEPGDPRSLAEAILTLVDDETGRREMGRRGRERVESQFTWDRTAARLATVLSDAADRRRKHPPG